MKVWNKADFDGMKTFFLEDEREAEIAKLTRRFDKLDWLLEPPQIKGIQVEDRKNGRARATLLTPTHRVYFKMTYVHPKWYIDVVFRIQR